MRSSKACLRTPVQIYFTWILHYTFLFSYLPLFRNMRMIFLTWHIGVRVYYICFRAESELSKGEQGYSCQEGRWCGCLRNELLFQDCIKLFDLNRGIVLGDVETLQMAAGQFKCQQRIGIIWINAMWINGVKMRTLEWSRCTVLHLHRSTMCIVKENPGDGLLLWIHRIENIFLNYSILMVSKINHWCDAMRSWETPNMWIVMSLQSIVPWRITVPSSKNDIIELPRIARRTIHYSVSTENNK